MGSEGEGPGCPFFVRSDQRLGSNGKAFCGARPVEVIRIFPWLGSLPFDIFLFFSAGFGRDAPVRPGRIGFAGWEQTTLVQISV
jgi:hypothetical protein